MHQILVVRLSSIGDIVHALPAVAALASSMPEARISWAIESRYAELIEGNPFVHRAITLDTLGWRRRWTSPRTWRESLRDTRQLRTPRPDVAVDFQGLVKSSIIARMSGARRRVGFAGRWLREAAAGLLYTERIPAEDRHHVVEENLALVESLGARPVPRECWQFPLPRWSAVEDHVVERLAARGAREFIAVNPGGGWVSKRWPPEHYAALISEFSRVRDLSVLVTGSPAEEPMINSILKQASSPRSYYFPSSLAEFIALMRRAKLFLGGDTGPLHLAAAVGTPIVAIYGPTSPVRNGPFAPDDVTIWNPPPAEDSPRESRQYAHWGRSQKGDQTYIRDVSVEQVLEAGLKRLARSHGA